VQVPADDEDAFVICEEKSYTPVDVDESLAKQSLFLSLLEQSSKEHTQERVSECEERALSLHPRFLVFRPLDLLGVRSGQQPRAAHTPTHSTRGAFTPGRGKKEESSLHNFSIPSYLSPPPRRPLPPESFAGEIPRDDGRRRR